MAAAFRCLLREYNYSSAREKLGHLISASAQSGFATHFNKQVDAWEKELKILEDMATELMGYLPQSREWSLLLEYEIPRRQKRPDVILLADHLIFVIEFKVDADSYLTANEWQVESYALDLRDFHAESREQTIIPVLVATDAPDSANLFPQLNRIENPRVLPVHRTNAESIANCIRIAYDTLVRNSDDRIDAATWDNSVYRPTPTIIEAAEQLFAGHTVAGISHSFATNLDRTCDEIVAAVQSAQLAKRRTICFVTGTPGAGKTLAGLNAVHNPALRRGDRPAAMFLSGNGPLVKIVREAIIRDRHAAGMARGTAEHQVSALIGNVHQFIVHHGINQKSVPPPENTIIFDEAQRAWDAEAVKKKHGVDASEPSMILEIMERAPEWCTIVALVGSGQEIHKGEAGLAEWGRSLNLRHSQWRILASADLLTRNGRAGDRLFDDPPNPHIEIEATEKLHLSVNVRSPRARRIGQWIDDLLHNRPAMANSTDKPTSEFPTYITRDLNQARLWLRERAEIIDGNVVQRTGLLASSGAIRLRADGIEVTSGFRKTYSYEDWFLSGPDDTRYSGQLEVVATEFECQGLELDWVGVCWGGDFVIDPRSGSWLSRKFRGKKWQKVNGTEEQQYLLNKYRVLLTRARRGMIMWIPPGDVTDETNHPRLFDATAEYLQQAGIPLIP